MPKTREFDAMFSQDTSAMTLPAGSVIFKAGEAADRAYVILEGDVEIVVGDKVLEVASKGSLVGEMALLDSSPRSATARALTNVRVVPLDQKRLLFLIQRTPFFAINVMRLMADRLRGMNAQG